MHEGKIGKQGALGLGSKMVRLKKDAELPCRSGSPIAPLFDLFLTARGCEALAERSAVHSFTLSSSHGL